MCFRLKPTSFNHCFRWGLCVSGEKTWNSQERSFNLALWLKAVRRGGGLKTHNVKKTEKVTNSCKTCKAKKPWGKRRNLYSQASRLWPNSTTRKLLGSLHQSGECPGQGINTSPKQVGYLCMPVFTVQLTGVARCLRKGWLYKAGVASSSKTGEEIYVKDNMCIESSNFIRVKIIYKNPKTYFMKLVQTIFSCRWLLLQRSQLRNTV